MTDCWEDSCSWFDLFVCVQIYIILLCESRRSNETVWISEMRILPSMLRLHFSVYLFHWLQISSISPRWFLMYQIKFQINLNLDFKVSELMFLLLWLLIWVSLVLWPIHSIEYLNQSEVLCSAATFWGHFF